MIKPYEQYRKNGLFKMKDFLTPAGFSNVQTYVTVKGKEDIPTFTFYRAVKYISR